MFVFIFHLIMFSSVSLVIKETLLSIWSVLVFFCKIVTIMFWKSFQCFFLQLQMITQGKTGICDVSLLIVLLMFCYNVVNKVYIFLLEYLESIRCYVNVLCEKLK